MFFKNIKSVIQLIAKHFNSQIIHYTTLILIDTFFSFHVLPTFSLFSFVQFKKYT